MRVVGYIRVSTEEQELSPQAQRGALEAWCATHGAELVAVYEDIAVKGHWGDIAENGTVDLTRRPGLLAAIEACAAADVLLVVKRDRLARQVLLSAVIDRLVELTGARVQAVNGAGNGASPEDALLRTVLDAIAQYERALISLRTSAAMGILRSTGRYTGGEAVYGYAPGPGGALVPVDEEQRVIQVVHAARDTGRSVRAIVRELAAAGYRTRRGGMFQPVQVRAMLRNTLH